MEKDTRREKKKINYDEKHNNPKYKQFNLPSFKTRTLHFLPLAYLLNFKHLGTINNSVLAKFYTLPD